jgi:hypothetical protein
VCAIKLVADVSTDAGQADFSGALVEVVNAKQQVISKLPAVDAAK